MQKSLNELKGLLSIAKKASLIGGRALSRMGPSGRRITSASRRDVKIVADRRSENEIVGFLRKESRFSILSEESGLLDGRDAKRGPVWIVDPLDGTLNFSRGIPISCVSVGLWDDSRPLLGAVYDFNKSELFTGIADIGAWLNGRRIKVSSVSKKKEAVLLTGFPSRTDFSLSAISSFARNARSYKKVRLLGSAAISLAYVAAGKADVYFEKDIMVWDVAAGASIVIGAGGRCRIKSAGGKDAYIVRASNKHLFKNGKLSV